MKKKISIILLSFLAFFILSSCNLIIDDGTNTKNDSKTTPVQTTVDPTNTTVIDSKPWLQGTSVIGHELSYEMKTTDVDSIKDELELGKGYCQNETNYAEFDEIYEHAEDYYYNAVDAYKKEYIKYCMYGKDENQDSYRLFEDLYVDIIQWFNEVEHMAFKNSFKNAFYEGMTDDEIIKAIGKEYPEKYYELKKEMNQLQADYLALDDKDKNYLSKVDNLYVHYVTDANLICRYDDYENYMDYSYVHDYFRDYTKEDTEDFFKYVMEYVFPAYTKIHSSVTSQDLSSKDEKEFNNIFTSDVFLNGFDRIEAYKEYMGGIFKEAFDGLFKEDGYYYISYDEDSYEGAFEDSFYHNKEAVPYVYFGNNYHRPLTVIHEFGHYFAATQREDKKLSYDLAETQSQADEFLFLRYLINNYGFSNSLKKAIMEYQCDDAYQTIMICALVNEIEKKCYSSSNFESGDLARFIDDLFTKYPKLSTVFNKAGVKSYVAVVSMYSPCYYISYATSLLGTLNINKMAEDDFDEAKEAYFNIINYEAGKTYREVYTAAGLKDPLSEEAFRYIFA